VSSALRCRSEEAAGYAESVLATPVSRSTWTTSHLAVTVVGTTVLVLTGGLAMGLSYALTIHDWWQVVRLAVAALASLPAVLVLVGVATVLFGWLPRAALAAWAALAVVALVDLFGPLLKLPDRVLDLSPFAQSPAVPAESWNAVPLVVITVIDVGLVLAGHVGFRRRDLATA
jgi:ABC-2 type transport system permease protein